MTAAETRKPRGGWIREAESRGLNLVLKVARFLRGHRTQPIEGYIASLTAVCGAFTIVPFKTFADIQGWRVPEFIVGLLLLTHGALWFGVLLAEGMDGTTRSPRNMMLCQQGAFISSGLWTFVLILNVLSPYAATLVSPLAAWCVVASVVIHMRLTLRFV